VIHSRNICWSTRGVWQWVFEVLSAEAEKEYAQINSTIFQAHKHSAGAKKVNRTKEYISRSMGRSSGGLTTKIHATCDALGNPTGFHLSPGQAHDLQGADVLLEALLDQIKALLADIAYAARARLLDRLEQHQVEAVIPPKSNQKEPWEFDQDKYRWRHLIENFFAKLKQYRGIATRYDKRACAFLGAIHWVAAVIWLN